MPRSGSILGCRGSVGDLVSDRGCSLPFKAESQNRSYIVKSSATFNVIEMPYKNLVSEFPSNSTAVSMVVRFLHNNAFGAV